MVWLCVPGFSLVFTLYLRLVSWEQSTILFTLCDLVSGFPASPAGSYAAYYTCPSSCSVQQHQERMLKERRTYIMQYSSELLLHHDGDREKDFRVVNNEGTLRLRWKPSVIASGDPAWTLMQEDHMKQWLSGNPDRAGRLTGMGEKVLKSVVITYIKYIIELLRV